MLPIRGANLNPQKNMFRKNAPSAERPQPDRGVRSSDNLGECKGVVIQRQSKSLSKGDSVAAVDAGSR